MTLTEQLAAALREAFDEGRVQGSDEATAYEYGARVSLKPGEAFDNVMADWNASSVPAITSLRAALAAYDARPAASDDVVERVARALSQNENGAYTPNYSWELVPEVLQDAYRSDARAALAAMAAPATQAKGSGQ